MAGFFSYQKRGNPVYSFPVGLLDAPLELGVGLVEQLAPLLPLLLVLRVAATHLHRLHPVWFITDML